MFGHHGSSYTDFPDSRAFSAMQTSNIAPEGVAAYNLVGQHGVMPETNHDEKARFNFLANLNRFLSTQLLPAVKVAYEQKAKPQFVQAAGRPPAHRREVREAMQHQPAYQNWSALRRSSMEMRQQAGRSVVLRQISALREKAADLNATAPETLLLDPASKLPRYIAAVDQHCMPGSYHTELIPADVSAAANYDVGIFATTGGGLGRYSDGGGWAVVEWLRKHQPNFSPKKILDLGCGLGHNTLPLAQAFPSAQVVAVDVAAPMLRYAHARAMSLGVKNIQWLQANAEELDMPGAEFDLVVSCMFLHETSYKAIPRIFAQTYRLLKPGGMHIHLEQPQYDGMDLYEQFIRDWDTFNNNEPFWTTMHEMDLRKLARDAGFADEKMIETGMAAVVDESLFPKPKARAEDYGRNAAWYVFGGVK
jgi:ubiquinone/menaquinone biosynthesis C-methylase UbiE